MRRTSAAATGLPSTRTLPEPPVIPTSSSRGDGTRFYLEAIRASPPSDSVGESKRLEDARRVLATLGADRYFLDMSAYAIGTQPLRIKQLRRDLRDWLAGLETDTGPRPAGANSRILHRRSWRQQDGWRLEFTAQQLRPEHAGTGLPLVRSHMLGGWGRDATRILAVLNEKTNKYGPLDAPLVVAVLSNTQFRTEDIDVERALFGTLIGYRPCPQPPQARHLLEPGHWCSSEGWRRARVPQVITAHGLYPWTVSETPPRLWTTLQAGVTAPAQPSWLARMELAGPMPTAAPADSLARLFGLPPAWSAREPRFVSQPRTVPL